MHRRRRPELMPSVSIVVPLFNKERYVRRALESIARQTQSDFEAIVVDDGSKDNGAAVVEQFPDSRFRLIRQSNQGPGAARNRGLAECSAELIAFLDADDEWLPDYLEGGERALRDHPASAVACAYLDCPGDRSSVSMWRQRN